MRSLGLAINVAWILLIETKFSVAASLRGLRLVHDSAFLTGQTGSNSSTSIERLGSVDNIALVDNATSVTTALLTREAKVEQIVAQDGKVLAAQTDALNQLVLQEKALLAGQQSLISEQHGLQLQQDALAAKSQAELPIRSSTMKLPQFSPAVQRYYPPYHPSSSKLKDMPSQPPAQLAIVHEPWHGRHLGNGALTRDATFLRVKRMHDCKTGRNYTLADENGTHLYATDSSDEFWNGITIFYQAQTGMKLGVIFQRNDTFRRSYEVLAYEPVCANQPPVKQQFDGVNPLYQFARMTKSMFTLDDYFTVERYICERTDSELTSLAPQFEIRSRFAWNLFSTFVGIRSYDIFDYGSTDHFKPIGMIDTNLKRFTTGVYYDAWVARHVDLNWFALITTLIDISVGVDEALFNWYVWWTDPKAGNFTLE